MEKRVQLIPLFMMIFCAGISLSSGLYYYDVKECGYLFPLVCIAVLYYVIRWFWDEEIQNRIAFLGVILLLIVVGCFFWIVLKPGFCDLMQTISIRMERGYGIRLGNWEEGGVQEVGLAVGYLVAIVTAISVFLYETNKPLVIVALPSFLMFGISITADGVPYGKCLVAYTLAALAFLGMGKRQGGVKKCALIMGCGLLTAVIAFHWISWPEMDGFLRQYRSYFLVGQGDQRVAPKRENLKYRDDQTIDFGQFSQDGDIYYSGTVQMLLNCRGEFKDGELFLRGFIGQVFTEQNWYDVKNQDYSTQEEENVFKQNLQISLTPQYDAGVYFPYSVKKKKYNKLLRRSITMTEKEKMQYETELKVDAVLENRIYRNIFKEKTFATVGDVIDYVNGYLASNYEYTLHPGKPTENELERFMFDTKQGYCTHFATAAVMLFRSANIPARMVQGYMIDGDKIKPDETLHVLDSDSHAWVEIYISKKGWIPVDVTPYTNRVMAKEETELYDEEAEEPVEDEFEEEQQDDEDAERNEESEEESEEDNNEEDTDEIDNDEQVEEEEISHVTSHQETSIIGKWIGCFWGALFLLVVLIMVLYWYQKREYCKFVKKVKRSHRGDRLLLLNEELYPFWENLDITWSYLDSAEMTANMFRKVARFYDIATSEDAINLEARIRNYIYCVYLCRFGAEELSEESYQECLDEIRAIIIMVQENVDQSIWKKIRKYNVVKYILTRKNGG